MATAASQFQRTFQGVSLEMPSALFQRRLLNSTTDTEQEAIDSLFADLKSSNAKIADEATEALEFLLTNGYTLRELALASLPLQPVDVSAIQKIASDHSGSDHPRVRQRAYIACSYLAEKGFKEGFTTAASLASKMLHSPDKEVQQEGVRYFSLLLDQFEPSLPEEDLARAIIIASEMFVSDKEETWALAYVFFDKLIGHAKEKDVLKIKAAILNAYTSVHYHMSFELCHSMVIRYNKSEDLISIPLQVAINACRSEKPWMRDQAFSLFWTLLHSAPEYSIETVIQGILMESKRLALSKERNPSLRILLSLKMLADPDSSSLSKSRKEVIKSRCKEDSVLLLEALGNLSSCKSDFIKKNAAIFKEAIESRLKTN